MSIVTRLLSAALAIPFSLFAAGHDISSIRTAPVNIVFDSIGGTDPAVASDGTHFLTIWNMYGHVYGELADPARGTKSDAFVVLPGPSLVYPLQLIAADGGYLAAWNDGVPSIARLTSYGAIERTIRLDGPAFTQPRIAFNGDHIIVVDQASAYASPTEIIVSVYDLSGAVVRRFSLLTSRQFTSYAVAAAGGDFVIATAQGSASIDEWRVSGDGVLLSTQKLPSAAGAFTTDISIAVNDDRIAAAWVDLQTATVSAAIIAPDGTVTSIAVPNGIPTNRGISILPVEIGFVVSWNVRPSKPDNPAVFAVRIGEDGGLLDARPVHLGDGMFRAAASSGGRIEFALQTPTMAAATLITSVDSNGFSTGAAAPAAIAPVQQLSPALTSNGTGFMAAWLERSAGPHGVMAGRVSREGNALDGIGLTIDEQSAVSVDIVRGATDTLVVWSNDAGIFAVRVSPFGARLDPQPIRLATTRVDNLATVWNGSRYFVVWPEGSQLAGAFVGTDGLATAPKVFLKFKSDSVFTPDVAWDGRQYIVVFGASPFQGCNECVLGPDNTRVMRVSASGDAIDTAPLRIPGIHFDVQVASSGNGSLIALRGPSDISTMALREQDGALRLGSEIPLFHWYYAPLARLAWNGMTYVVGWQQNTSSTGPAWLATARVTADGFQFDRRFASTGPGYGFSMATNDVGETALALEEVVAPSRLSRARLYLTSEMSPTPAPPPPPPYAISYFTGHTARIEWKSGGALDGFLIEQSRDFGKSWGYLTTLPPDVLTFTIAASIGDQFRVSALGPGGLSQSAVTSIGSMPRRHAAGR
jgi:hypothetical protein